MVQAVNSLNSIICLGLVYVQVQDLLNDNYILSFGEQKTAYFFIAYTVGQPNFWGDFADKLHH